MIQKQISSSDRTTRTGQDQFSTCLQGSGLFSFWDRVEPGHGGLFSSPISCSKTGASKTFPDLQRANYQTLANEVLFLWLYSSYIWQFVVPWTIDHQTSLSMGFSRQEYWSEFPFPSPGDLAGPRIEPASPALVNSLPLSHQGKPSQGKGSQETTWGKIRGIREAPETVYILVLSTTPSMKYCYKTPHQILPG